MMMRIARNVYLCLMMSGVLMMGVATDVLGQEAYQKGPREVRIFTLENASSKSTVNVLASLISDVDIAEDRRTNSIIVQGSPQSLDDAGVIIGRLDAPTAQTSFISKVIDIQHRDALGVAGMLNRTIPSRSFEANIDQSRQSLVLWGTVTDIELSERLIAQLDQPKDTLHLSFFFVEGRVGDGVMNASEGSPLPESLQDVAAVLVESGFPHLSLQAPLSTHVQEGETFTLSGTKGRVVEDRVQYHIQGKIERATPEGTTRLSVQASVNKVATGYGLVSIETSIVAVFDEYIVLTSAPSGSDRAIALIIKVGR